MQVDNITKCLGLVSQYNPLSVAPGALVRADDCFIRRENVVEDRRGYKIYATLSGNILKYLTYNSKLVALQGTTLSYDNGSGVFSDYTGSYTAPSSTKVRFVEVFGNLYITTNSGVKAFYSLSSSTGKLAGAPRALDLSYSLNAAASGFLSNTSQCAYRALIQRTDSNKNIVSGYPSQRLWVTNSSGTSKNVDLTMYLPAECVAGDVFQIYRTSQVSGVSTDTSADECGLVYQRTLVSADITAGYITFTDSITDSLIGAKLYSSPSQEGLSQGNDRPPLAKDLALFKDSLFYGNCSTKQRLYFTLVGTSGLTGKTITLAGVTYNFGATEIISGVGSPQAKVYATGVAASDIDNTARSLVKVINRYSSNTSIYAYYLSGPEDLPGQIMVEERGLGGSTYTIQSSDSTISGMIFPEPPVSPSTNSQSTSTNDDRKNYVYYSKTQQPEHVPALNYLPVGSSNKAILRLAPLRDSLIVIKEDGVFRISGEGAGSFTVSPLDLTVICKAPNTVSVLSNQVFMFSNQGVVAIGEAGAQVVSRDIELTLMPLLTISGIENLAHGVGYETERSYFLSVITTSVDTAPNQTFVYNAFTKTWVRHTYGFIDAIIDPTYDKLFLAKDSDAKVYQERKSFTDDDYSDPETAITISAISGTTVSFTISGATPDVGGVISQGGTGLPIKSITSSPSGFDAVVDGTPPTTWTTGAATYYPGVGMAIEWAPWTANQPGLLKAVHQVGALADSTAANNTVTAFYMTFKTNFDEDSQETRLSQGGQGWGGAWGVIPWGGSGDSYGYPTGVPKNKHYSRTLSLGIRHRNALEKMSVCGVSIQYRTVSERVGK